VANTTVLPPRRSGAWSSRTRGALDVMATVARPARAVRVAHECDAEADALRLAPGQLLHPRPRCPRSRSARAPRLRSTASEKRAHHRDQLADGQVADERPGLQHRADGAHLTASAGFMREQRHGAPSPAPASRSSMSIAVDLPAPFRPSRATVSPGAIEDVDPRTAGDRPCGVRNVLGQALQLECGGARVVDCVVTSRNCCRMAR